MTAQQNKQKSSRFLASFHYFRGISILIIVAGHCFYLLEWQPGNFVEETFFNFFVGGTSLFVFISGFLFHHIFYENFKYKKFLNSKLRNILLPYLFMSILPITLEIVRDGGQSDLKGFFFIEGQGIWIEYVRPAILYILTGKASLAYWYIPFAMILFLLSPVFISYIKLNLGYRRLILLVSFVVPIVIHRPIGNLLVLQSVFYFTPVYLLGIQSSIHRDFIYKIFRGKELILLLMAVGLAASQAIYLDTVGNFQKSPFVFTVPDIMILQKCMLCIFFMVFLNRFKSVNIPVLNKVASASFSIFFLHALVIKLLRYSFRSFNVSLTGLWEWFILALLVTFACYFIASFVKKLVPNASRMLIGW